MTADQRTRRGAFRKSDELLGQIIDIVRRTGLEGFSLDMLAAELGTSARMLVYYFGSKDELLARIVQALREDHIAAMESAPPGSITEAIDRWWNHYRANLYDMQFFFHLTSRSFEEPAKFTAFQNTAVEMWLPYFYRSQQGEERPDEEKRARARLVLATVRGLTVDLLITRDPEHVEHSLAAFKDLLRAQIQDGP